MRLGIITGYIRRPLVECAERVAAQGLRWAQVDFKFPDVAKGDDVTAADCRRVRAAFAERGIGFAAVSGHANLVAPDTTKRAANARRLRRIMELAPELGTSVVVTETGTRHPIDDWAAHPDTALPGVYEAFRDAIGAVAERARQLGVTIALEGGVGNVIDTAAGARRILEDVPSPALGLVMDPANFLGASTIDDHASVLADLFAPELDRRILLAHAKDARRVDGTRLERHANLGLPDPDVEWPAPGQGVIDYGDFLRRLARHHPDAPLLIEHVAEDDLPRAKRFVEERLAAL
jgi:sugar phosphate isomerase/epimerase